MQFTPKTLQQMLRQSVDRFASKVCFSFVDGEPMTYAQLGQTVREVQRLLECIDEYKAWKVSKRPGIKT